MSDELSTDPVDTEASPGLQGETGEVAGGSATADAAGTGGEVAPGTDEQAPAGASGASGASGATGPVTATASTDEAEDEDEDTAGESEDDASEDPLEVEGDVAADYLEELLDIADLDGDIDTYAEGGRAHVSIVTENQTLVGKDGEVLDALQELARLAVMTETGHRSRLMLDIAGHRERRRKELHVLAQDAIAEVKTSGEAVRLAPMNPFERKIVHDAVAEAGLVSESEGVEPKRRVVVLPA